MQLRSFPRHQRGVAPIIIVAIIVVVAVVVIGAIVVGSSTPSTPGTPPSGCFPAGTQCRVFVQNEVSCCGGQQVVGQAIGWCIGWWDGIPCRGTGMHDDGSLRALVVSVGERCDVGARPMCGAAVPATLRGLP